MNKLYYYSQNINLTAGLPQVQAQCKDPVQMAKECQKMLIPNPDHPIYAPIIGGADPEFARDMCR